MPTPPARPMMEAFAFRTNMGFTPSEVTSIRSQLDAGANQRALLSIMGGLQSASAPGAKRESKNNDDIGD